MHAKLLDQLVSDLARHEGFRQYAYPDPRSALGRKYAARKYNWGFKPGNQLLVLYGENERDGRPWTYGFGFTRRVTPTSAISKQAAIPLLSVEVLRHIKELNRLVPTWESMPLHVQTVLGNLIYNLGYERLSKFAPTLALFTEGDYVNAAARLRRTAWFKQVGIRAVELVERLEKGAIAPQHRV